MQQLNFGLRSCFFAAAGTVVAAPDFFALPQKENLHCTTAAGRVRTLRGA
jgi:hypothetical protein